MTATFVREAVGEWNNNSTTSPSVSFNSSGCDFIKIDIVYRNPSATTITGVTHNGDACSQHESPFNTSSPVMTSDIWQRIAPDIGTFNVIATASAAIGGAGNDGSIRVRGYTGAHQTTPLGVSATNEASGSFDALSTAPASDVGDVVSDVAVVNGAAATVTLTPGASQTAHGESAAGIVLTVDTSDKAGAATSTTMTWGYAPGALYNAFQRSVAVKAAAAASTHAGPLVDGALIKNLVDGALIA